MALYLANEEEKQAQIAKLLSMGFSVIGEHCTGSTLLKRISVFGPTREDYLWVNKDGSVGKCKNYDGEWIQ